VKRFLALLALSMVFSLIPSGQASANGVIENAMNSTVVVYDQSKDTSYLDGSVVYRTTLNCSGFIVASQGADELIITAGHCGGSEITKFSDGEPSGISEYTPEYVQYFDGDHGQVKKTYTSKNYDVMLMVVHSTRYHPPTVPTTDHYQLGDEFFVLGQTMGNYWTYGKAFAMQGDYDGIPSLGQALVGVTSAYYGNSGSPVFNLEGEVVGMVNGGSSDNPTIMLITRTQRLHEVITEAFQALMSPETSTN
jgi:S1-C subfamily serine protease